MDKIILLLGCILFEGQGVKRTTVVEVTDVKLFNTEDELNIFIDELEESGNFDSYMVMGDEKVSFNKGIKKVYDNLLTQRLTEV